jgi:hypothetical protein
MGEVYVNRYMNQTKPVPNRSVSERFVYNRYKPYSQTQAKPFLDVIPARLATHNNTVMPYKNLIARSRSCRAHKIDSRGL